MKYFLLFFIKYIIIFNLYSKDINEYKFNWYPRITVEDDVITFLTPLNTKYIIQLEYGKIILEIMV